LEKLAEQGRSALDMHAVRADAVDQSNGNSCERSTATESDSTTGPLLGRVVSAPSWPALGSSQNYPQCSRKPGLHQIIKMTGQAMCGAKTEWHRPKQSGAARRGKRCITGKCEPGEARADLDVTGCCPKGYSQEDWRNRHRRIHEHRAAIIRVEIRDTAPVTGTLPECLCSDHNVKEDRPNELKKCMPNAEKSPGWGFRSLGKLRRTKRTRIPNTRRNAETATAAEP